MITSFDPVRGLRTFALAVLLAAVGAPVSTLAADDDAALYKRVDRVLKRTPLIDGHNDIPWQYRMRVDNHLAELDLSADLTLLERPTHTDFARLREGRVGGQFWSVYIPIREYGGAAGDTRRVLEQIDLVHRMIARYPDTLELALTAADVRRAHRRGRIASMMGIEGGHAIEDSLAVLRMLYDLGARYMTLTHGKSLRWADSATGEARHDGLTPFGVEVVREMNRLGMLVDLSHVTPATMHDALDATEAPVIFSHSSAKAVTPHVRNVPDDVLRRVATNDGVVMVTFFFSYVSDEVRLHLVKRNAERDRLKALHPDDDESVSTSLAAWDAANVAPKATMEQVADHIDHVRKVAGIDHIGVGGDYDGMPPGPVGLEDVSGYPNLFVELLKRGYSDRDIAKIAGGNVLRVMEAAEKVAARLQRIRPASDATLAGLDGVAASD